MRTVVATSADSVETPELHVKEQRKKDVRGSILRRNVDCMMAKGRVGPCRRG